MCHVQLTIWTRYRNSAVVSQMVAQFIRDYASDEYNIRIITDSTKVNPAHKVEILKPVEVVA